VSDERDHVLDGDRWQVLEPGSGSKCAGSVKGFSENLKRV
jgi:hypothetical protein